MHAFRIVFVIMVFIFLSKCRQKIFQWTLRIFFFVEFIYFNSDFISLKLIIFWCSHYIFNEQPEWQLRQASFRKSNWNKSALFVLVDQSNPINSRRYILFKYRKHPVTLDNVLAKNETNPFTKWKKPHELIALFSHLW